MKIVQINSFNGGSTGNIALNINKMASQNNWDTKFYFGRYWKNRTQPSSSSIKIAFNWETKFHATMARIFDNMGHGSWLSTKKLISKLNFENPDIIHLHNIHGYYINYPLLFDYLRQSGKPIVWTLHDCWSFTGHCAYFDYSGCNKWKTGCHNCPQIHTYPKSLFIDNSERNYNLKKKLFLSLGNQLTLVPVSNWLKELIKESFFKETKIITIHNGIDTTAFSPQPTIEGSDYVLGVASPWSERKGLNDFFMLRSILPSNIKIVLVGLSKQQIKGLPDGISGIERTQNINQLAALYSNATIFFNPTYEDNFPTTNLEALACGTPVLTYNTGGSPEAVTEKTGFVIPQGDLQNAMEIIQKIKREGKSQYSETCREYALKNFRKEDRFSDYIKLYEDLLNKR